MDAHRISRVVNILLSHQTCSRMRYNQSYSFAKTKVFASRRFYYGQRRNISQDDDGKVRSQWQQRTQAFPPDKLEEFAKAPMVTAEILKTRRRRPRGVKMLTRDFIDDSLYNPHYGYFPKHATIFSPGEAFDFQSMKDEAEFYDQLGERYKTFEDTLDKQEFDETRQLWHTPTELFRPHYGEAVGRYLVSNYRLSHHPHHDLVIYEVGAGNGTLMLNILDYIRDYHPDVYPRTKFNIIEISAALASLQAQQIKATAIDQGHADRVEIINRSIFDWDIYVPTPCYFLALEVFDNFAHDVIRLDPVDQVPMQGQVLIDHDGNFYDFYSRGLDSEAQRFLSTREAACAHQLQQPWSKTVSWIQKLRQSLPMAGNLAKPEFIPTRLLQFFETLYDFFPMHHLVAADFHYLPDTIRGVNAPVVQTRFQRRTVTVTTPYVLQGYFDILFPTDFAVMENMYRAVTGKLTRVTTQRDWLSRWAYVDDTRCQNGENPMLSWYQNSSVMIST